MNVKTGRTFLPCVCLFLVFSFVLFPPVIPYSTVYASSADSAPAFFAEDMQEDASGNEEDVADSPENSAEDSPDTSVEPFSDNSLSDDVVDKESEIPVSSEETMQIPDDAGEQEAEGLLSDSSDVKPPETDASFSDDLPSDVIPDEESLTEDTFLSDDSVQTSEPLSFPDTTVLEEPEPLFFDKSFVDYTVIEGLLLLIFVVLFCGFCINMTSKIMNWRMY